jgi:hypothetical protein
MCGILVTTDPEHFARIDARAAQAIYEEVSISAAQFANLVAIES